MNCIGPRVFPQSSLWENGRGKSYHVQKIPRFMSEDIDVDDDVDFSEKYSQWDQFVGFSAPREFKFEPSMFFSEEIQEILLDDKVEEFLSTAAYMEIPRVYVAPNIPKKRLKNGLSKKRYGVEGLLKENDIWLMVDEERLFSPKFGVMVTNIGIFWRAFEVPGSCAIPWRINDSRITHFVMSKGIGIADHIDLAELSLVIDDELHLQMGTVGPTNNEMNFVLSLLNKLIEIANEQHLDASGGTL